MRTTIYLESTDIPAPKPLVDGLSVVVDVGPVSISVWPHTVDVARQLAAAFVEAADLLDPAPDEDTFRPGCVGPAFARPTP